MDLTTGDEPVLIEVDTDTSSYISAMVQTQDQISGSSSHVHFPIDIWYIIYEYLSPIELFKMERVTLTHYESLQLTSPWMKMYERLFSREFGPLRSGVNAKDMLKSIANSKCHYCVKKPVRFYPEFPVRMCSNCFFHNTTGRSKLRAFQKVACQRSNLGFHSMYFENRKFRGIARFYWKEQVEKAVEKYQSEIDLMKSRKEEIKRRAKFELDIAQSHITKLASFVKESSKYSSLKEEEWADISKALLAEFEVYIVGAKEKSKMQRIALKNKRRAEETE